MKRYLFQGDSITDAGRSTTADAIMGYGYATMTAGKISNDYPGQYEFLNRGISGNKSTDLYARIKRDIINLKPDIMSILIGVNDVWHDLDFDDGVTPEKFETIYDTLLCETKAALPSIKIIMLEPFVLNGTGTASYYEKFRDEVRIRAEIAKKLAQKHGIPFVPLQDKITKMAEQTSSAYVLLDGVHPTFAGHELISRELYQAFRENV